jgi:mono/diheme cytochrome c family protein
MKQVVGLLGVLLVLSACSARQSRETVVVNPFSVEREAEPLHGEQVPADDMNAEHHGGPDAADGDEGSQHAPADSHTGGHDTTAHGDDNSHHAPGEVANELWNRETSYEVYAPTPAPQTPTLSYGGGDSSSGRVIHGISGNSLSFNADTPSEVEPAPAAPMPQDSDAAPRTDASESEETDTSGDDAVTEEDTSDESATDESADDDTADTAEAETEADASEATPVADFDWQQLGETTYIQNCSACHQANGEGIPGAFPPLAGHIPNLYNADGGREYLIKVVLYGLQGQIEVNGMTYNGAMNPWGQLSDEQIAAALNHELTSWGNDQMLNNFNPILPDEVSAQRGLGLTGTQVLEARPDVID